MVMKEIFAAFLPFLPGVALLVTGTVITALVRRGILKKQHGDLLMEILSAIAGTAHGGKGFLPHAPSDTRAAVQEVAGALPVRGKDALVIVEAAKDVLKAESVPFHKWEDAEELLRANLASMAGQALKDRLTK